MPRNNNKWATVPWLQTKWLDLLYILKVADQWLMALICFYRPLLVLKRGGGKTVQVSKQRCLGAWDSLRTISIWWPLRDLPRWMLDIMRRVSFKRDRYYIEISTRSLMTEALVISILWKYQEMIRKFSFWLSLILRHLRFIDRVSWQRNRQPNWWVNATTFLMSLSRPFSSSLTSYR